MSKTDKDIYISVRDATGEAVWNSTEVATWGATWYGTYNATDITWDITRFDTGNSLKDVCYEK